MRGDHRDKRGPLAYTFSELGVCYSIRLLWSFILVSTLPAAAPSMAQTVVSGTQQRDVSRPVVPQTWLTGRYGVSGAKGYDATVRAPFVDLAKCRKIGVMAHLEGLYREWVAGTAPPHNTPLHGDSA